MIETIKLIENSARGDAHEIDELNSMILYIILL